MRAMTGSPTASRYRENSSWRDLVKVHPAADLFPMMPNAELGELVDDLAKNGLRSPIVFWTPDRDAFLDRKLVPKKGEIYLLDGRNRLAALAQRLDLAAPDGQDSLEEYVTGPERPTRSGYPEYFTILGGGVDPYDYVVSANLRRRHLTGKQKRELIAKLLKANPEKSDRSVAKLVGASPTTAGDVRHELEQAGDVSKLDTRIDTAGRKQPRRAARKLSDGAAKIAASMIEARPERGDADIAVHVPKGSVKRVAAVRASLQAKPETRDGKIRSRTRKPRQRPTVTRSQDRDTAISQFSLLFHAKPRDTFDDLTRIFRDEYARVVAEIPTAARAAFARDCLGLKPADLGVIAT
jgi:hypothetical protein